MPSQARLSPSDEVERRLGPVGPGQDAGFLLLSGRAVAEAGAVGFQQVHRVGIVAPLADEGDVFQPGLGIIGVRGEVSLVGRL